MLNYEKRKKEKIILIKNYTYKFHVINLLIDGKIELKKKKRYDSNPT